MRIDRPNTQNGKNDPLADSKMCLSESKDLLTWKTVSVIAQGRFHYWDEKIGAGSPPVKTKHGWLHLYHGIAGHLGTIFIYQAGVMLLDLKDPSKVISRGRYNILEPRELYELTGQVPNVVFPSGIIVEEYDSKGFAIDTSSVKVYYGAADTVVGLALSTVQNLVRHARNGN